MTRRTKPTDGTGKAKRRRWPRVVGLTALGLVVLLIVAAGVLWVWKPWLPPIPITEPGPGGERVQDGAVFGNYYAADEGAPAVLLLGGSEGGLGGRSDRAARELNAAGYHTLAIAYHGGPGQSTAMSRLPLETFDEALAWLAARPGVDAERMAVLGASTGAEAALLIGTAHPELRAVIAVVPSSVVWQGFDLRGNMFADVGSTWSRGGAEVPYLPIGSSRGDPLEAYRNGLAALPQHPDAVIPVERIEGGVLLLCGEQDGLWPSCEMSRQIEQRAAEHGGPEVTLLDFPEAGHIIGGPRTPEDDPAYQDLGTFGGTPASNAQAQEEGWNATLEHLRNAFA